MILTTIERLYEDDPWRQLTPGRIYAELGQRPNCGGCFPTVVAMIIEQSGLARDGSEINPVVAQALQDLLDADPKRISDEETVVGDAVPVHSVSETA